MTEHPHSQRDGTSVVAVMGWVTVLGIMAALWLARSEPTQGQASQVQPQQAQPQLVTAPPISTDPRILKFSLTLSEPDDLKVRQGDYVTAGDVLADRTRDRNRLQVQQQKAQFSLQQIQAQQIPDPPQPLPVPPVSDLPPVAYRTQEAAIAEVADDIDLQKRKIDLLATMPPSDVPPAMREHEERILEQLYRDLESAQAALKEAQEKRAYQEYEYTLAMARRAEEANQQRLAYNQQRQQAEQQRRDKAFQEAQLQAQLEDIEAKLSDLSTVRSPYAGSIRRVKWLGQSDNRLSVEITLAVAGAGPTPSPPPPPPPSFSPGNP
jgi:multidrug efflux pump subunit AcrA (membrane-fusion protein)